MKVALLGTGFGRAHAAVYHRSPRVDEVVVFGRTPERLEEIAADHGFATTTDLDSVYADPDVDLVDVCLPVPLHAAHAVRATEAGKHVLCELPLAADLDEARRVAEVREATGRQAFVDMFARFDPATEHLLAAVADGRHGELRTLEFETRAALLWPGATIGLDVMALETLHSDLDVIVAALGTPRSVTAAGVDAGDGRSAAEVLLDYPGRLVRCLGSSLNPVAFGMSGGFRASFTGATLVRSFSGAPGNGMTGTLTEYTARGTRTVGLPERDTYAAVIDHVLDCLEGRADNRISPASVLDGLKVTLDVHHALTGAGR
ncbi:Gfo/Idh/MocA family protein [Actinomadura kijaniata]|uniref:Gfo/Idh/MocA family protein n=1 Tax=Actinomadura kijaniata TaxID=46161 RepID=UPI003F1DFEC6